MKKTDCESKEFYKSLVKIVGPIAGQNLISAAVNSADVIMLGFVGQTAIAAASLANQIQFVLFMIATGLSSGLIMLCAQYWGKKDTNSIRTLFGIAMKISASAGFIFSILALFIPDFLMQIFTSDTNLISEGSSYLRAVGISYFLMAISQTFQAGLKSVEKVKAVTLITTIALLMNIFLNAIFIFGLFGIPKLGLVGAGIATTIARCIELMICCIYSSKQKDIQFSIADIRKNNKFLTVDFIKYSLPALGNELVWGLGFSVYSVILGHLGEDIVAANSVVNVVKNLATVIVFGMAYGGAIILGKQIGSGQTQLAERNAKRLVHSTIIFGIFGAILVLVLKPVLPLLAELNETASNYRDILLYINAYSVIGATINTVFICGLFRAGGDARFGFILDVIIMWFVSIPLGILSAFVFKLSPLWVYFILYLDEFEKIVPVIIHYKKKNWLKNITRNFDENSKNS